MMSMFDQTPKPKQAQNLLFSGFDPSAWWKGPWMFDFKSMNPGPDMKQQQMNMGGGDLMKMFGQAQGRSPASKGFLEMLLGR